MGLLTIHDGKGGKNSVVPLPEILVLAIGSQLEVVPSILDQDLSTESFASTFLLHALEPKYPKAPKEFNWPYIRKHVPC